MKMGMQHIKIVGLVFVLISFTACTTKPLGLLKPLSEEGQKVAIVFSEKLVKNCHFVNGLKPPLMPLIPTPRSYAYSYDALKEKAVKMGGNRILIPKGRITLNAINTINTLELYHCSEK